MNFITLILASIIHKTNNVVITKGNNEVQETLLNSSYNSHAEIKLCIAQTDANPKHFLLATIWF